VPGRYGWGSAEKLPVRGGNRDVPADILLHGAVEDVFGTGLLDRLKEH
jgi:hypothetical protein